MESFDFLSPVKLLPCGFPHFAARGYSAVNAWGEQNLARRQVAFFVEDIMLAGDYQSRGDSEGGAVVDDGFPALAVFPTRPQHSHALL